MRIDSDEQVVSMLWEDFQETLLEFSDAKEDLENTTAALRASEAYGRRNRRAFVMASCVAAVMTVVALVGWVR